jgi:hypothetical protein
MVCSEPFTLQVKKAVLEREGHLPSVTQPVSGPAEPRLGWLQALHPGQEAGSPEPTGRSGAPGAPCMLPGTSCSSA